MICFLFLFVFFRYKKLEVDDGGMGLKNFFFFGYIMLDLGFFIDLFDYYLKWGFFNRDYKMCFWLLFNLVVFIEMCLVIDEV